MTTPLTREERERIEAEAHKWAEERLSLLPQDELNARLRLTLGNVFALLSTIDSLEAQVKEAEAQRDNDRRAVRSLERVKDENDALRAHIALLEKELRFWLETVQIRQDLDTGEELTWSGNDVDTWMDRSLRLLGYEWHNGKVRALDQKGEQK